MTTRETRTSQVHRVWVTAEVDEQVRDALRRVAKSENRTISAQIRQFIAEGLERRGVSTESEAHNG